MRKFLGIFASVSWLVLSWAPVAHAQATSVVVTTCGTQTYATTASSGSRQYPTQDTTGAACSSGGGGGGGTTQIIPGTTGGLSTYVLEPAASDNHAVIKNGAGQVYSIHAFNNSATINYMRLYNLGTGFNGCGSATGLLWEGHIPASTSDAGFILNTDVGVAFSTGISICVTSGYGQTNTTAATATAMSIDVLYK